MAKKKLNDKELIELGKKLEQFYETGYIHKNQALLFSFWKGLVSGLGGVLGGTIVVAILLWVLSLFNQVPILDHFVQALNRSIRP